VAAEFGLAQGSDPARRSNPFLREGVCFSPKSPAKCFGVVSPEGRKECVVAQFVMKWRVLLEGLAGALAAEVAGYGEIFCNFAVDTMRTPRRRPGRGEQIAGMPNLAFPTLDLCSLSEKCLCVGTCAEGTAFFPFFFRCAIRVTSNVGRILRVWGSGKIWRHQPPILDLVR